MGQSISPQVATVECWGHALAYSSIVFRRGLGEERGLILSEDCLHFSGKRVKEMAWHEGQKNVVAGKISNLERGVQVSLVFLENRSCKFRICDADFLQGRSKTSV